MIRYMFLDYLLILATLRESSAAPNPAENAQEFGVFCSIAELAGMEPELRRLDENINTSAIQEDFRHFELLSAADRREATGQPDSEWMKRNEISNQSLMNPKVTPLLKKATDIASRLSANCRNYDKLKDDIEDKIKILLKQAIFGEKASTGTTIGKAEGVGDEAFVVKGSSGSGYEGSCKSDVTQVGKTLLNDMFCLCVGKTGSEGLLVCADGIKSDSSKNWPTVHSKNTIPASWEAIYEKCPKHGLNLTTEAIRLELGKFLTLLGKAAGESTRTLKDPAPYFFGKASTNYDCTGQQSQNVCVNYFSAMTKGAHKGIRGIQWADKYLQAAQLMEQFNKAAEACAADKRQLLVLHAHANALFRGAIQDVDRSALSNHPKTKESENAQLGKPTSEKLSEGALTATGGSSILGDPLTSLLLLLLVL